VLGDRVGGELLPGTREAATTPHRLQRRLLFLAILAGGKGVIQSREDGVFADYRPLLRHLAAAS
jgi:hypothetical protein